MRYRYHLCHLVFVHPTGVSSSRYPSPGASVTHALSRHGSLLKLRQCKCRVLEAIYNCIFSLLCQSLCCLENARPPALRYLCTDAVYPYCILNSSTHCRVCRAVSRLNHICKRASIRYTSVRLSSKRPRQGLGRTFSLSSSYA